MSTPTRIDSAAAPWIVAADTRAVVVALARGGRPARFVGGCVRDALIGRRAADIDIATPEPPPRVIELLSAAGIKHAPTGIEHGTVTALPAGGRPIEVTTLRRDLETDGRHAVVEFTDDWRADAARRDFTINALSADPDGAVHDYFGGVDDLNAGRVRFVGDPETRIREDVLRILRFFRFFAHYGRWAPDAAALAACARLANLLPSLSGERIAAELLKLLAAEDPSAVLTLMRDQGVLAPILAELGAVDRLRALQRIAEPEAADPILRLAALLYDPDHARAVAERLRLSGRGRDRLMAAVTPRAGIWPVDDDVGRRRALYRLGPSTLIDVALLAWAGGEDVVGRAALALARSEPRPALPVRGADALALGVTAGPEVGRLLEAVEGWWEAGDYRADREACLAELRSLVEGK